jgi:hypothetical protein
VEAPPYPPAPSFRSRARLLFKSLASPRGPFMVELFIAAGFSRSRRAGHARSGLLPGSKLPTPAGLHEVNDPRAPRTGFGKQMPPHPLRSRRLSVFEAQQSLSASPTLLSALRSSSAARLLGSFGESEKNAAPPSDRMSGLLFVAIGIPGRWRSRRITPTSLRRAGRAPLDASGSTGQSHDGKLLPSP